MTDLVTFLDNNIKLDIYTMGNRHELYHYLESIGSPTTLVASGQSYHRFFPSSSANNDTETLQPVIAAPHVQQKNTCELCGRIRHKANS